MMDIAIYLRQSLLAYLWCVASVAWLIHAVQHILRHGGVLFEVAPGEAAVILARTTVDVTRPLLVGALLLAPFVALGYLRWRRRVRR